MKPKRYAEGTFINNISAIQERCKFYDSTVSKRSGLSPNFYHGLKNGCYQLSPGTAAKLASVFNVGTAELFAPNPLPPPSSSSTSIHLQERVEQIINNNNVVILGLKKEIADLEAINEHVRRFTVPHSTPIIATLTVDQPPQKRKRGRPRKVQAKKPQPVRILKNTSPPIRRAQLEKAIHLRQKGHSPDMIAKEIKYPLTALKAYFQAMGPVFSILKKRNLDDQLLRNLYQSVLKNRPDLLPTK